MVSKPVSKVELGYSGSNTNNGIPRPDEFLRELKGSKGIANFRNMRDNDPTIGGVMYAMEQILKNVPIEVKAKDDSEESLKQKEFVESILGDMEHSLSDHVSEALNCLTFGFMPFEAVYKRRRGPHQKNKSKKSKYSDDLIGVRKLSPRAPWTITKFEVDPTNGDLTGLTQQTALKGTTTIPIDKLVHYKMSTANNDFSGRSVLRNAYKPWYYANELERIEAIGVERELHGIPVITIPSEYLHDDAEDHQKALVEQVKQMGRDVRFGEDQYIILPSDPYIDPDGKVTGGNGAKKFEFNLLASSGSRNIDPRPIIRDYRSDCATSILASFLTLGQNGVGSYSMDESKKDLFLLSMESYMAFFVDTLQRQLIEPLWDLNNLNYNHLPTLEAGDVADKDLQAISGFLRNLNQAEVNVSRQPEIVEQLMKYADLPFDAGLYTENQEKQDAIAASLVKAKETSEDEPPEEEQEEDE